MQELINKLMQNAGINEDQAYKALETIKDFVKEKFPMLGGAVDNMFASSGSADDLRKMISDYFKLAIENILVVESSYCDEALQYSKTASISSLVNVEGVIIALYFFISPAA